MKDEPEEEEIETIVEAVAEDAEGKKKVYIPGLSRGLKNDEEWECDKSAYRVLEHFSTDFPCLTFDPLLDGLGEEREEFPLSCMLVAGTQASNVRNNSVVVLKLANLKRLKTDEEEEEESDEEDELSSDEDEGTNKNKGTQIFSHSIPHHGGINRIRAKKLSPTASVCAVWNDQAKVQIWNLTAPIESILKQEEGIGAKKTTAPNKGKGTVKPLFSFVGHRVEGFALDWSPLSNGTLATGDNDGRIHVWRMAEGGEWAVDLLPYKEHKGSVEDIQWSHSEESVFCSCSSDGTIRLWDTRVAPTDACVLTVEGAHGASADVNVISWSRLEPLLLSGGDDGQIRVWDLKSIHHTEPAAKFKHHKAPVNSVDWSPHDGSVFVASGEDDQTSIWDLAVERDDEEISRGDATVKLFRGEERHVPAQLLFVHMGQTEVKEARWHPQLKGLFLTSAADGFNVARTISV